MHEQILLEKWQTLDSDDQEKVIAFINTLQQKKSDYQPKTELGKKLWELRQKIVVDPNIKLLDWDEIEAELDEIRGRNQ
ncbi:hypothetical protein [Crocosphaera sp. XPORK-15E]|uniref:hypothetical protein n=1 Tax=Crocosphaera sp. XPORK-15E TaxID=3110247 RepID=UPI002B204F46|nr:hypothetical protein [Crocosphaera sp. XPORK-15E]MEA5535631.1 hypothetical protein [Crocosphaera sp. XPORK-15E]